ncbi:hypothetical protein FRC19_010194, partial [Serendipita sp. 401]
MDAYSGFSGSPSNAHQQSQPRRRSQRQSQLQGSLSDEGQFFCRLPFHGDHHRLPSHCLSPLTAGSPTSSSVHEPYLDASGHLDALWYSHANSFLSSEFPWTEIDSNGLSSNDTRHFLFPDIPSGGHQCPTNNSDHVHRDGFHRTVFSSFPLTNNLRHPNGVSDSAQFSSTGASYAFPSLSTWMDTCFKDNDVPTPRMRSSSDDSNRARALLHLDTLLAQTEMSQTTGMVQDHPSSFTILSSPNSTETPETVVFRSPCSIDVGSYPTSASTLVPTSASIPFSSFEAFNVSFPLPDTPSVRPQSSFQSQPLNDSSSSPLQSLHHRHQHQHNYNLSQVPPSTTTTTPSWFPYLFDEYVPETYQPERECDHKRVIRKDHDPLDEDSGHEHELDHETITNDRSSRIGVSIKKSYPCPGCPRVYSRVFRREACINKHNGVKPYHCKGACGTQTCLMAFYGIEHLNRHRRLKNMKWTCPD